ncbi:hypothetical protein CCP2SC5_1560004 [Azospirillaceae bacterium]
MFILPGPKSKTIFKTMFQNATRSHKKPCMFLFERKMFIRKNKNISIF